MKNNKLVIVGTMAFDEIITPTAESGKILGGAATYIGLAAAYANKHSGLHVFPPLPSRRQPATTNNHDGVAVKRAKFE